MWYVKFGGIFPQKNADLRRYLSIELSKETVCFPAYQSASDNGFYYKKIGQIRNIYVVVFQQKIILFSIGTAT